MDDVIHFSTVRTTTELLKLHQIVEQKLRNYLIYMLAH